MPLPVPQLPEIPAILSAIKSLDSTTAEMRENLRRADELQVSQEETRRLVVSMAAVTEATRELAQSGLEPSNCRLLGHEEALLSGSGDGSHSILVVGFESAYRTCWVNVPWIAVPFDVISFTWSARTWFRKNGLYGTRTRDSGCVARELM